MDDETSQGPEDQTKGNIASPEAYKPTPKDIAQLFWNRKKDDAEKIINPVFSPGMLGKEDRWAVQGAVVLGLAQEQLKSKIGKMAFRVKYKASATEILPLLNNICLEQYIDPMRVDQPKTGLASNEAYLKAVLEAAILLLQTNRHGELNRKLPKFTKRDKDPRLGPYPSEYEYAVSNAGIPKAFMAVGRARTAALGR